MKLSSLYTTSNLPYVRLTDTKSSGTAGTSYATGAYRTVEINTENSDSEGICSLSSNQFTLSAGTYAICITAQQFEVTNLVWSVRLRNVTDSSTVFKWPILRGQNHVNNAVIHYNNIFEGRFSIAASKALEVQIMLNYGTFGQSAFSDGENEVYWVVELAKLD